MIPHPSPARVAPPAAGQLGASLPLRWTGGRPVVLLSGEVDLSTAEVLTATGELLRRWQRAAVVDAAAVTFIDVSGLRAVMVLAGPTGCVEVHRPSPALLRLLTALERVGAGPLLTRTAAPDGALVLGSGPAPTGGS